MRTMARVLCATALLAVYVPSAMGETLSRRGFFGARLTVVPEGIEADGVYLETVMPGSSAEAAGLRTGDILTRIGALELEGREAVLAASEAFKVAGANADVRVEFIREGETASRDVHLSELPKEEFKDAETIHDEVAVGTYHLRLIATRPRGADQAPAVVFLQGLGCSSVEWSLDPVHPIRQLLQGWSDAGYATIRVEKSGMGDSAGPPCGDIAFDEELKGYLAASAYVFEQPWVDPERVFLFGHSMGGVFAPYVAAEIPVRGVIAYGTIAKPLQEYFLENDRRQLALRGASETHIERQLDLMTDFHRLFFDDALTPGEIAEREPRLRSFLAVRDSDAERFFGRHYTFWQQLNERDVTSAWEQAKRPVLAIWGEADYPASRDDHPYLVDAVNRGAPGMGTYLQLPNIGHGFDTAASMKASMDQRMSGEFNRSVVDHTVEWMRNCPAPLAR